MNKNTGFTLIEVLIAMLVLGVGLLGLAGLQATGLRNSQSAYNRSQATELAYDMADRMRANDPINEPDHTNVLAAYIAGVPVANANCKNTTGCSATDMAKNDLYEWNCAVAGGCQNNTPPIAAALPGGAGAIAVAAGVFTITISWTDKNNNGVPVSTTFQTSFRL